MGERMRIYDYSSDVELIAIKQSGFKAKYAPQEKIRVLEVSDFPSLGKITAIRFIEWCQKNPGGTISLPTGKTPEHFIYWTSLILKKWEDRNIKKLLEQYNLDFSNKPDMMTFVFVQIDEFFPVNPEHENSFINYIKKFYIKKFGLDEKKAMLMNTWISPRNPDVNLGEIFPDGKVDLSLRYRQPVNRQEQRQQETILDMDQYAMEYEQKIREIGGIGFFLGGIGPDGHIGFNIRGSDHFSTTRLTPINYETAAAAASDLGGIEISRGKIVMTVGIETIILNPTSSIIINAAGESKASVVRDAVMNPPSIIYPATALSKLVGSCFFVTTGAARLLTEREIKQLKENKSIPPMDINRIVIDIAVKLNRRLNSLTVSDLLSDGKGSVLVEKGLDIKQTILSLESTLKEKIEKGTKNIGDTKFLHTGPHHDDIMLGYMPYIIHLVRNPSNSHYFATLTSGFTSVTNAYVVMQLKKLEEFLKTGQYRELSDKGYFNPDNTIATIRDIYHYLDGVAANSVEIQNEASSRRLLRNIISIIKDQDISSIKRKISWFFNYFETSYPGKKDVPDVQMLKGMIREWEEELLWAHLGFNYDHIFHMRLPFYTGDIFTRKPQLQEDIKPVFSLIEKISPDVITVAMDPEASGPDTHYKVLQAIAAALKLYLEKHPEKKVRVWGYRNVWYRFHPSEADIIVPVSMNSFAIIKSAFNICFGSQRSASFPSYEYDGPFCDLAQKIMADQYAMLKICLGREFFYSNPVPRIRATRGLTFLRDMDPEEFFAEARHLKELTETEDTIGRQE